MEVENSVHEKKSCLGMCAAAVVRLGLLALTVSVAFSFLGRWGYPWELFSHFQMQYFVGLLLVGLLALLLRRWKTALVAILICLAPVSQIAPLFLSTGRAWNEVDNASVTTWRLMLLNVNTATGRPELVLEQIEDEDPDLIVLVEINERWVDDLKEIEERYPYLLLEPKSNNFGIGIYSRRPITQKEVRMIGEAQLATLFADIRLGDQTVTLVATHPLPPIGKERHDHRDDQLRKLADELSSEHPMIVCGDFNTTRWSPIFRDFEKSTGLHDSARGFGWQPTWPADQPLVKIPIDQCLGSRQIHFLDRRIGRSVGSDHLPVHVRFGISDQ